MHYKMPKYVEVKMFHCILIQHSVKIMDPKIYQIEKEKAQPSKNLFDKLGSQRKKTKWEMEKKSQCYNVKTVTHWNSLLCKLCFSLCK